MDIPAVTLGQIVQVWYNLACTETLTRSQLGHLKALFDGVAQKYDGTLALLRAQTVTANELQATMQPQTQVIAHLNEEIARLRTRLSAAEGRHVDAALIQGSAPHLRQN